MRIRDFRIAQANLKCEIQGCRIPPGHYYTWVHRKHKNARGNEIIKVLRACPECAQSEEKETNGHE